MDSVPPVGVPHTLLEFLTTQAMPVRRQRKGTGSGDQTNRMPLMKRTGWGEDYFLLVEEDRIFARVAASPPGTQAGVIAEAFRDPFRGVWGRIPGHHHQLLLGYWSGPQEPPRPGDPPPHSHPRPLIQVDDGPWSSAQPVCNRLGHALRFPVSWVVEYPERLPLEIARALARCLRYATRRHWALIQEKIEVPLTRWEKRQGAVSDEARDRKLDQLEGDYLRAVESEIAQILRGWGF